MDWKPIETAPRDGTEFIGGRWWQGRFLQDILKFHPQDGKAKLIHSRYRHRMDASVWCELPSPPSVPGE